MKPRAPAVNARNFEENFVCDQRFRFLRAIALRKCFPGAEGNALRPHVHAPRGPIVVLPPTRALAVDEQNSMMEQLRHAYCDGIRFCADAAASFIGKQHASSVRSDDVASGVMSKIKGQTYLLTQPKDVEWEASKGIADTVAVFNKAMRKTEELAKLRLEKRDKENWQSVYDKVIGQLRYKVAYALADKLKEREQQIRRG